MKEILSAQFLFLIFRKPFETQPKNLKPYFIYVLMVTWIVGVGRYWDSPDANLFQHSGLGSVIYLLIMSAILWVAIFPIARRPISYGDLVLFVGMTSLPALLYAIPVEMFMPLGAAAGVNYIFLTIVAIWRVALLFSFCSRAAQLSTWGSMVAAILPLSSIMIILATFSLEHVTFGLMSGMRVDEAFDRSAASLIAGSLTEAAGWSHSTVNSFSIASWLLFPIVFISWIILFYIRNDPKKSEEAKLHYDPPEH